MRILLATILCGGLLPISAGPVLAQGFQGNQYGRGSDPNMGHFYMGRQEIQITDTAPTVNDMRTNPGPPGRQAAPARPAPLPRAGFMQNTYSQSAMQPAMNTSLPKVVNGVPPKQAPVLPQPKINPKLANAGKYKPKARPVATTARTYAPYKGYGAPPGVASGPSTYGGPSTGTSTAVSGSLLHWTRTGRRP